jgi:uncharacterized membrane protein (Fun14 family)
MTPLAVTATHQAVTSDHTFLAGILVGLIVGWFLPEWVRVIVLVVALTGMGILQAAGRAHFPAVPCLALALAALIFGLWHGRYRGLRHLGESDYRGRVRNVKSVSRWL